MDDKDDGDVEDDYVSEDGSDVDDERSNASDESGSEDEDADEFENGDYGGVEQFEDRADLKHKMDTQERTTRPVMTKFERTRVLGVRVRMLLMGAPAMVEGAPGDDELQIAVKELEARTLPLIIRRQLGPGLFEYWRMKSFIRV
jgi:DNA-directed RNA polymerase I, II, and III subunit RPABC2